MENAECYTVRLPVSIKRKIKILSALMGCTQQELITLIINKEYQENKQCESTI